MEITVTLPALTRLSMILEMVCKAIAHRTGAYTIHGYGPLPLVPDALRTLVWHRIRRAETRFRAFVERFYAGTIRPYAPRATPSTPPANRKPSIPPKGPRKPGWLFALLQHEAGAAASQLRHLLTDPEMRKIIAAHPKAAEILRPACRMLALEPELRAAAIPLPAPDPNAPAPTALAPDPSPPEHIPGVLPPQHLRVLWRPQNHP